MIRKNIYITKQQNEKLIDIAYDTGLTMSELIRRAIDEYPSRKEYLENMVKKLNNS